MGLLATLLGSRAKERAEAGRLGITVREVTRELPEFAANGRLISVEPDKCVRYSVPRRARGGPTWSLLQRTVETGATYPNDYLLTKSAPLPAALEERLRKIAEAFPEELFEFEGTDEDVAVYWAEWGGPEKVRELHAHLQWLAAY
jgi:hypothetical protein